MQIKTPLNPMVLGASIALLIACSEGKAESTASNPASSTMTTELQEDDLPAPADVAAPPADATKTASGLAYKVLSPGTGTEKPYSVDEVTVHYTGWTTDGKMFDSSVKRGRPATFPLGGVIAGWTEGLQLMTVGEKARFWIPEEIAYRGTPGKPAGLLVFDVELISIKSKPRAPEDLNSPPATAVTTASGLKYQVLSEGTGVQHPGPADQVTVHYSGWTTDGQLFDSSVDRGAPAVFPLNGVIEGWTEGLQLMVAGEKARLWVPEALAYKGEPGAPAGLLVFDVELISIKGAPKTPDNLKTPPADAQTTESGLVLQTLKTGDVDQRTAGAGTILVHFSFWDQEGKMYQSSRLNGTPVPMSLKETPLPGLTEALSLLHLGQTVRVWIPENLSFGDQPGAPKGTMVFDIEVTRIIRTPENYAQAPADATRTESGLAYQVIQAVDDAEAQKPTESSKVLMHYTGWNSEGELFDTSHIMGEPTTFNLNAVMPGWTEGLQFMKPGETYRFWIPESLAMGGRQGSPKGSLLFDIELISFE